MDSISSKVVVLINSGIIDKNAKKKEKKKEKQWLYRSENLA